MQIGAGGFDVALPSLKERRLGCTICVSTKGMGACA
jgi:hypothetical protein